jgi:YD repeat-containing protein
MLLRERSPKEVRAVFESNGARQSMVSRLEVLAYDWHVSTSGDGGPFVDAQSGVFNAKGHLIHLTDDSGARYTYRYRLDGDTLTIRLVESDAGMAGPGVSDDAFQYGQFAAPFTRAD